jgi:phospholipase C
MPQIDHVIVLALENRSFDHMLGWLVHPDPHFEGLGGTTVYSNPNVTGAEAATVAASDDALPVLPIGPAHSHDEVMAQLAFGAHGEPTNQGFVQSYARTFEGTGTIRYGGLLGPILTWWANRRAADPATGPIDDAGRLIMRCQAPERVPVTSTLAREFAVCTRWFCSVPGETWPNRNFLHAATSDGETGIVIRPYNDKTIFELLEENDKSWHIYHADTPQAWAFPALFDEPERHARWFPLTDFAEHAAAGLLPNYSFLEPDHGIPVLDTQGRSNSQHPDNNRIAATEYEGFSGTDTDFDRGEQLIAYVYEALRANPELFERSLLLVTYDEHGGFYDHVPPPHPVPAPADRRRRLADVLDLLWHRESKAFDFTQLGPRVPTLVISPYIARETLDITVHDHASVPATLRALFAPHAEPLTERDRWATPVHGLTNLDQPRRADALPDLSAYQPAPRGRPPALAGALSSGARNDTADKAVPPHLRPFAEQAGLVLTHLDRLGEPETATVTPVPSRAQAVAVTTTFAAAAARHRTQDQAANPISSRADPKAAE